MADEFNKMAAYICSVAKVTAGRVINTVNVEIKKNNVLNKWCVSPDLSRKPFFHLTKNWLYVSIGILSVQP